MVNTINMIMASETDGTQWSHQPDTQYASSPQSRRSGMCTSYSSYSIASQAYRHQLLGRVDLSWFLENNYVSLKVGLQKEAYTGEIYEN